MLREYRLTNFKAFGETVTIPIRPLTLIFGANSSGKSSIFQSLLLLKQTLEEAKDPGTVLLPKGSLVDLGMYRDFVHRHETERNFGFGARFGLSSQLSPKHQERKIFKELEELNLNIAFDYKTQTSAAALGRLNITVGDETRPSISYSPRSESFAPGKFGNHGETRLIGDVQVDINPETEIWRRLWKLAKKGSLRTLDWINDRLNAGPEEYSDDDADDKWYKERKREWSLERSFLQALRKHQLEDIIKDVIKDAKLTARYSPKNFLLDFPRWGAHRGEFSDKCLTEIAQSLVKRLSEDAGFNIPDSLPKRSEDNLRPAKDLLKEGLDIFSPTQSICSFFRRFLEDLIYLGPLRIQPERHYTFSDAPSDYVGQAGEHLPSLLFTRLELLEQTNNGLERLDVKYQVKLDKLQYEDKSPSNVFSLRLIHTDTGIDASLRDVGFGISQVLPIVVQSQLSEKKTLLIEQPEIHLHPAHQAELGDMFIRSALGEQKNTLLLETHSENLILRILRRIRETTEGELPPGLPRIRPEDVAVLYVQPGEKGAQVIEIPVTEDGDFARPWPQGFFEESAKELF